MQCRVRVRALWAEGPESLRWIPDAVVGWDERGRLTEVGPWDGQAVDEDLRPYVLTPGFVDGHVHFPQSRIVGAASGPLLDWLARSTFPEEARFADAGHARRVAAWFCQRLAASGTTLAFAYGSVHPSAADLLLQQLATSGLRAIAGPVLMDEGGPEALMFAPAPALDALEALASRWHGYDGRLAVAAIPRFGLSCSREMMRRAGDLARAHGWWVSTHLSENLAEITATCEKFGAPDYLAVYEEAGLVHERCVLAHCIHPSEGEWARLLAAQAVVAHCPDSNDFLGSGGMPVARVLDAPQPWVLGTDVAAGRSFRVPRIASAAHDNALRQGRRVAPVRWLWAATRGGALAFGVDTIGLLKPGLEADLVLHELPAWAEDAESALGWLLFDHDAPPALRTWVRGRPVWSRPAGAWGDRGGL